jgi:hypothetical protein
MAARKALAVAATAGATLPALALPDGFEVERTRLLALADLGGPVSVESAEEYTAIDAFATELGREESAWVALRQATVTPLKRVVTAVEAEFRPAATALANARDACKRALGAWALAQAAAEAKAREAARVAAESGDSETLVVALNTATAAAVKPDGGARVGLRWAIKRIVPELLAREYFSPDMARIEAAAVALGVRGDEPPVIPGVVFERVADVAAGRK